jgi:hypothetical protein
MTYIDLAGAGSLERTSAEKQKKLSRKERARAKKLQKRLERTAGSDEEDLAEARLARKVCVCLACGVHGHVEENIIICALNLLRCKAPPCGHTAHSLVIRQKTGKVERLLNDCCGALRMQGDLDDSRFAALLTRPEFAFDPTNPHFKRPGVAELASEVAKRKKAQKPRQDTQDAHSTLDTKKTGKRPDALEPAAINIPAHAFIAEWTRQCLALQYHCSLHRVRSP